ncbi:MAG TPA: glycosyltransferase family 2 protein [Bacteroidia bacterium]|nr:glycosyltransferase family 2 protein [Bacteroidota bacterium]HQV98784.1 glycosyltransferase family 2 protein [Bacteroidia bacterium]HQW21962.1 glycosyltransferase family 2 protein [Bacteroidia bacterium]
MNREDKKEVDLSVVIPVYSEELVIDELYNRLSRVASKIASNYELIFVNDGSKDNSLASLIRLARNDNKVYFINFSRNFGHQIAVTAGLDLCCGKTIVIIDGDLQDPPELIEEMFAKYKEGFEVVYARRTERNGESWFKKITAKLFYRILRKSTNIEIPIDTGDFRLIDKRVADYLKLMPEQNKFLRGQIAWLGFRQTHVLFTREKRKFGKSGYSVTQMLRFAMDGITGFSDKPLSLVTRSGFFISFLSFIIILYAIYSHYFLNRTITGWTSLIISSMFVGGIQLISIGIIGEYISRINKNVINRPLYIIESTNIKSSIQVLK